MIHVEGLGKRFLDYQRGWVNAISDISFDCEPGAIFGLLGPEWRRQNHDVADLEHGAQTDQWPRDRRRS